MRVAIISDMHGNLHALKAVLEDIEDQEVDQILCGGDIVNKGPHPAECLQLIRELDIPSVMGNTDQDVLNEDEEIDRWVHSKLSADGLDFLRAMPQHFRLTPPNGRSPEDDLLLVHSTPRDCYDLLVCEPHPKPISPDDGMTIPTPEAEAIAMLDGAVANLIVYGHIHYSSFRVIKDQMVTSIGAVGLPLDGDQRAAYGIAEWNGMNWELQHYRVEYDVDQAIQAMLESDMPTKERVAAMLKAAQWVRF